TTTPSSVEEGRERVRIIRVKDATDRHCAQVLVIDLDHNAPVAVELIGLGPRASKEEGQQGGSVPRKQPLDERVPGLSHVGARCCFVEGSGVELRGQSFVSTGAGVTAVNDLLLSVPELQVAPIFTSSPDQLRRKKVRLEERSGLDLADLSLYFHVTLGPGATGTSAERLIDALNALPIVEFAEPVPMPAPPPSYGLSLYQAHPFAAPDGIGATQVTGVAGGESAVRVV